MKPSAVLSAIVVTASLSVVLSPSIAAACPVCATDNGANGTLKILAVFLAVPFAIALIVIPMIVRAVRQAGP